jgi:hypothetical protein
VRQRADAFADEFGNCHGNNLQRASNVGEEFI